MQFIRSQPRALSIHKDDEKKEDGSYYTIAPLVRLIPAAYKENLKRKFEDNDEFELIALKMDRIKMASVIS